MDHEIKLDAMTVAAARRVFGEYQQHPVLPPKTFEQFLNDTLARGLVETAKAVKSIDKAVEIILSGGE